MAAPDTVDAGASEAVTRSAEGHILISAAAIAGSNEVADLVIRDGLIAELRPTSAPARNVCLPRLADLHLHACRAFLATEKPVANLGDAVREVKAAMAGYGAADYARHSAKLFERSFLHGTSRMRAHADLDASAGLTAVQGSIAARARMPDAVDIEIVAFLTASADPVGGAEQAMLRAAIAEGADLVGAALDFAADTRRSIDALLDLAAELEVGVDVHLDEHLDPARSHTRYFAEAVLRRPQIPHATVSHACAVAELPSEEQARVFDALLSAGITIVAMPTTNLFLQDRQGGSSRRRGMTSVRDMIAAGVPVRLASDNIRDPFYPFGDADLLEIAALGATTLQIVDEDALIPAICDGRAQLKVGDPADLVVVPGTGFQEILSTRPTGRIVICGGEIIGPSPFRKQPPSIPKEVFDHADT